MIKRVAGRFTLACAFCLCLLLQPGPAYGAELVARWSFDEGEGEVARDSAGENHGKIRGASWTEGKEGAALDFDGEKSHVVVEHSDDFNLTEMTLTAWIYPRAYPSREAGRSGIAGKNYHSESTWGLRLGTSRKLHFRVYGPFGEGGSRGNFDYGWNNNTVIELDRWQHVAVSWDGSRIRFYVNGELDAEYEESRKPYLNEKDIIIGATAASMRFFDGIIDEVRIYSGALSHEEILKEYRSLAGLPCGWDVENAELRLRPYSPAPMRSGAYPEYGSPVAEKAAGGGVEILEQVIPDDFHRAMTSARRLPLRREMTDEELLASIKLSAGVGSIADLAERSRKHFAGFVPYQYWGFRNVPTGKPISQARETYGQYFTEEGALKETPDIFGSFPSIPMMRWGGSYWNTGEERWAEAVRDAFNACYRVQRPPMYPVLHNRGARGNWHTLTAGAAVSAIIESYGYVHDSPSWTDRDHANFWKGMLERARFLRYTTVPYEPEPGYNVFGYHNWLLYQLQGLLAIAACFPDFIESDDWLAHATRGIGVHADWQVMPDGGFAEYSYSYLAQVSGQFVSCYNIFSSRRLAMPERFRDNLLRLLESFLKIAAPGGNPMPFGDTHRRTPDRTPGYSRWAALAFIEPRFKHFAGEVTDEYIEAGAEVLHPDGPARAAASFRAMPSEPPCRDSDIMPEVGWAVMRAGWEPGAGAAAMTYRASGYVFHSHWEMLGFNVWAEGEPLMTKQLGFFGYQDRRGFPESPEFCRTPLQANHVLVEGKDYLRVNGSLRDWFASDVIDYIHADHGGWDGGRITARRRLAFVKPHWIVILDDIEGEGRAGLTWQAHTDVNRPEVAGRRASVRSGAAAAEIFSFDSEFFAEEYAVPAAGKSIHLLKARRSGRLPQRFVTAIYLGGEDASPEFIENGADLGDYGVLRWEGAGGPGSEARFLSYEGRGVSRVFSERIPERAGIEIDVLDVNIFAYHGRPDMMPAGVAARVAWEAPERGNHSVFYREAGKDSWNRQYHPVMCASASVLLPDLKPKTLYELVAVTETGGGVIRSPVLRGVSPERIERF